MKTFYKIIYNIRHQILGFQITIGGWLIISAQKKLRKNEILLHKIYPLD